MRILVTGAKGQLGHDVVTEASIRRLQTIGVDHHVMDITNKEQVQKIMKDGAFDAVIHCAAWTDVDKAEDDSDSCRKVNVDGTKNIVDSCEALHIPMMYFSTDYVFNGKGELPWNEYDECQPLSVYGQTKYEGEQVVKRLEKHFIVRVSWLFGKNGKNFVNTMLTLGKEVGYVSVVNNQIGSPSYTKDVAKIAIDMIQTDKYGTYHVSNEGVCSWYEFACEIFKEAGIEVVVTPVDSSKLLAKALRPSNSRMNKTQLDKSGFQRLPSWQDALSRYLLEIKMNNK